MLMLCPVVLRYWNANVQCGRTLWTGDPRCLNRILHTMAQRQTVLSPCGWACHSTSSKDGCPLALAGNRYL